MNRLLVTGAGGMLGKAVLAGTAVGAAGDQGFENVEVLAFGRDRLDLRYPDGVRETVRREKPDVVVNCAAWTAVDDAETHEIDALAVNGSGVRALAEACADVGARLIHVSTDYVFDGTAAEPYREDAPTAPINAYGRTKLAGEHAVLRVLPGAGYVVRTAWLYGAGGRNFVDTMIGLEAAHPTVKAVDDQMGQPTWTGDLAARLLELARSDAPPGVYHGTSAGRATWYDLAREVFVLLGADPGRVLPTGAVTFARPAARPAYSVLGHDGWARAGMAPLRDWRDALHAAWPSLVGGRA
ncbi:dTDP-4-dehydrorhamnose reductase [Sphaerisporangium siamense]|uniref:dTDP-4-dehydrorhamnose reductase n=1 Tax=Sphaerisporangium siamense TaxID=795645 RepID=A0A7W7D2R0_9ACTN|nr:dTDP-4-dehydrorhamnose reductase [Sphaerisporangium siamense]MBB4698914.1 dTDP-4-dehydrorhamnose reductase [Sphaerisporangium siamense]GII89100.1 dTDP-4-dehydrorhamnose reductase [Sphaerisporangium siamense]